MKKLFIEKQSVTHPYWQPQPEQHRKCFEIHATPAPDFVDHDNAETHIGDHVFPQSVGDVREFPKGDDEAFEPSLSDHPVFGLDQVHQAAVSYSALRANVGDFWASRTTIGLTRDDHSGLDFRDGDDKRISTILPALRDPGWVVRNDAAGGDCHVLSGGVDTPMPFCTVF
jgi:hypothetical protein